MICRGRGELYCVDKYFSTPCLATFRVWKLQKCPGTPQENNHLSKSLSRSFLVRQRFLDCLLWLICSLVRPKRRCWFSPLFLCSKKTTDLPHSEKVCRMSTQLLVFLLPGGFCDQRDGMGILEYSSCSSHAWFKWWRFLEYKCFIPASGTDLRSQLSRPY